MVLNSQNAHPIFSLLAPLHCHSKSAVWSTKWLLFATLCKSTTLSKLITLELSPSVIRLQVHFAAYFSPITRFGTFCFTLILICLFSIRQLGSCVLGERWFGSLSSLRWKISSSADSRVLVKYQDSFEMCLFRHFVGVQIERSARIICGHAINIDLLWDKVFFPSL